MVIAEEQRGNKLASDFSSLYQVCCGPSGHIQRQYQGQDHQKVCMGAMTNWGLQYSQSEGLSLSFVCNFHAPPTCKTVSASPRTPKDSSSCDTRPEVQDLMIYIGSRCILNKTYKLKRQVVCSLHTQDTCKKCFHLRRRRLGHVVIGCTMLKSTGQIVPTSLTLGMSPVLVAWQSLSCKACLAKVGLSSLQMYLC